MTTKTKSYPPITSVLVTNITKTLWGPFLATLFVHYVYMPVYSVIINDCTYDDAIIFTLTMSIIHCTLYFGMNFMYMAFDYTGVFGEYKLPRTPGQLPSSQLVRKTIIGGMLSQIVIGPLLVYYLLYPGFVAFGMNSVREPENVWITFREMVVCNWFNITGFYFAHRLFHESKFLYQHVHKQHHQYAGSIGFAAEYAHPLEEVLANFLPTAGGALFQGVSGPVWYVFLMWRLQQTYEAHSGYSFKGSWLDSIGLLHADEAHFHDYHHTKNRGCFGSSQHQWDWLLGTMDEYIEDGGMFDAKKKQ